MHGKKHYHEQTRNADHEFFTNRCFQKTTHDLLFVLLMNNSDQMILKHLGLKIIKPGIKYISWQGRSTVKIIPLVIHQNKGGEILYLNFINRLHAKLGIFK